MRSDVFTLTSVTLARAPERWRQRAETTVTTFGGTNGVADVKLTLRIFKGAS